MSEIRPLARKNKIVVQILEKEILVYDLEINKAFSLNKTSAMVWQLCDGKNPVDEIAKKMSVSLQEMVSEDFVWMSLEQLKKENLVESESIQNTPFEGLSRREMVRKIGVTSMIALPMISSLVAPTAINAASGCFPITNNANENPIGCPCDSNSDCRNPNACCGVVGGDEICVAPRVTPACQQCRGNCECPTGYVCPAVPSRPRICRPAGVPVPPLPAPDNCV